MTVTFDADSILASESLAINVIGSNTDERSSPGGKNAGNDEGYEGELCTLPDDFSLEAEAAQV